MPHSAVFNNNKPKTVTHQHTYPVHGFHQDLPKGKASGQVVITESVAHADIAGKAISLPLDDLQLTLGGASDRLIFLMHPSVPSWRLYTSDRSLLSDPNLRDHPTLGPIVQKARRVRHKGWGLIAAVVLLLMAIPVLMVTRMDWLSHRVAEQIPEAWEDQLADSALAQYKLSHQMLEDSTAKPLLQPLTGPLIEALQSRQYDYAFYISDDTSTNAFALPGGTVVIHTGLILRADSAEELLGVLAHEISHVTEQHGLRNVISTAGLYLVVSAVLGDASGLMATLASAAPFLLSQSYSREYERDADKKGHAFLTRDRIHPSGLATFFEKLMADENKRLASIEDENTREAVKEAMGFLSTHPASEERIQYLKALPIADQDYRNLEAEFIALQTAVKQFSENNTDNNKEPENESNH